MFTALTVPSGTTPGVTPNAAVRTAPGHTSSDAAERQAGSAHAEAGLQATGDRSQGFSSGA